MFSDTSVLMASLIWGAVGSGYLIYGWRQRSAIPFVGGVVMVVASYFVASALYMSLVSIALIVAIYWLSQRMG